MTVFDSAILGVIEGITEFLPISSTGHLIVASEFLGIEQTSINKAYEVIIQFAAILAVILNYPSKFTFSHINLWMKVLLAFLPIAIIGFIFCFKSSFVLSLKVLASLNDVSG